MNMLRRWTGRRANGGAMESTRRSMEEGEEFEEMMTRPFLSLQRQINRAFDSFFNDFPMGRGERGSLGMMGPRTMRFEPQLDLVETAQAFKITADVPGMTEDDIEITVSDNSLAISGERSEETEKEGESYYHRERNYGMFRRRIPLPESIERDDISATFKNGVLTIEVPKTEEARSNWRKIEVKSE